jgi:S-DNA-T family DNA segregation ATPase FtsK/SpoIIIE
MTARPPGKPPAARPKVGVVLWLIAGLGVIAALGTYDANTRANAAGLLGWAVARTLVSLLGWGAWLVPVEAGRFALAKFARRRLDFWRHLPPVAVTLVLCGSLHLLELAIPTMHAFGGHFTGGYLGMIVGDSLCRVVGIGGICLLYAGAVITTVMWKMSRSPHQAALTALHSRIVAAATHQRQRFAAAWRLAAELEQQKTTRAEVAVAQRALIAPRTPREQPPRITRPVPIASAAGEVVEDAVGTDLAAPADAEEGYADAAEYLEADAHDVEDTEDDNDAQTLLPSDTNDPKGDSAPPRAEPDDLAADEALLDEPAPPPASQGVFVMPRLELLAPPTEDGEVDESELEETSQLLDDKLRALGIAGDDVELVSPGRIVTRYAFRPPSSLSIKKIKGLGEDLQFALAGQKVRVLAPMPGTTAVGFEVPNKHRSVIRLRELLQDKSWVEHEGTLPIVIGLDVAGAPVYCDLAALPHLLVAGATGSGKSIGLTCMLLSLLMRNSPSELGLVIIDPKKVEFAAFTDVPHLRLPVVKDMNLASRVLQWTVDEMHRRYQTFAEAGARDLASFNARARARTPPAPCLPRIVLVIDEFATLKGLVGEQIEEPVMSLAQMARAAGIHVILATQRPDVKVITGAIKANFPARISYKVAAQQDSQTILGRSGAQSLLGNGDMLCMLDGGEELQRAHGPFVSEDEVRAVCDHLRAQCAPFYDDSFPLSGAIVAIQRPEAAPEDRSYAAPPVGGARAKQGDDEVYDRAVSVVANAGYCSISLIQGALSIGYQKAARLVERMETEQVCGPASRKPNGRREVYVKPL